VANIALREGATADIGLVGMDEFHFYGDPDRGWAWQVPLLELPVHSRATIADGSGRKVGSGLGPHLWP
jgi:superfamily II RNA helicase